MWRLYLEGHAAHGHNRYFPTGEPIEGIQQILRGPVEAGLVTELVIRDSEARSAGEGDELFIGERRVQIVNAATFVRNPANWRPLQRRFDVIK